MHLRQVVGIALLFAAVPLQMYLMKYRQEFRQLVSWIGAGLPDLLREKSVDFTGYVRHSANEYLQSVYKYLGLSKLFGADGSLTPSDDDDDREVEDHLIRNFRPPHMEFRVGDVVMTRNMIVGAVVGWQIDKSVNHGNLKEYFIQYDGIRYVPKKWVQKMYPKD